MFQSTRLESEIVEEKARVFQAAKSNIWSINILIIYGTRHPKQCDSILKLKNQLHNSVYSLCEDFVADCENLEVSSPLLCLPVTPAVSGVCRADKQQKNMFGAMYVFNWKSQYCDFVQELRVWNIPYDMKPVYKTYFPSAYAVIHGIIQIANTLILKILNDVILLSFLSQMVKPNQPTTTTTLQEWKLNDFTMAASITHQQRLDSISSTIQPKFSRFNRNSHALSNVII